MRVIKFRAWHKWDAVMLYEGWNGEVFLTARDLFYHGESAILQQFTGLHDKNGKEVYEGDVVICSVGCEHVVEYKLEMGGKFFGGMPAFYLSGMDNGYAWTGTEEVIGNIYEHPELIQKEEKV